MTYQATEKQKSWFFNAPKEHRAAFLAKGPAEVPSLVRTKTMERIYRPMVRGFLVNEETYESFDAALTVAESTLVEFQTEAGSIVLDERSLGIDDTYRTFGERLESKSIRIDWIVPLIGLSDALPDVLDEWLESIDEEDIKRFAPDMPAFSRIFGEDADEDDDRTWGRMERADMFGEAVREDCLFGVLLQASQPVREKSSVGGGFCYSWGYTHFTTFYGDTPEIAIEKAIEWGEVNWTEGAASAELPSPAPAVTP